MSDLPRISLVSETRPLAATLHHCTICGLPIAIGTLYDRYIIANHDLVGPNRHKRLRTLKCHYPRCEEVRHG
jgi:hypothetical protein